MLSRIIRESFSVFVREIFIWLEDIRNGSPEILCSSPKLINISIFLDLKRLTNGNLLKHLFSRTLQDIFTWLVGLSQTSLMQLWHRSLKNAVKLRLAKCSSSRKCLFYPELIWTIPKIKDVYEISTEQAGIHAHSPSKPSLEAVRSILSIPRLTLIL